MDRLDFLVLGLMVVLPLELWITFGFNCLGSIEMIIAGLIGVAFVWLLIKGDDF